MSRSDLQEPFLREIAATFQFTKARILERVLAAPENADAILEDELRGLFHGLLVIVDGGTALANQGLVRLVDEDGKVFDRFLHEIGFQYWDETRRQLNPGMESQ